MSDNQEKHEKWAIDYSVRYHPDSLVAIRSALGDASHMCDAVARDILASSKRKSPSKELKRQAAAAIRCGNAILDLRNKIVYHLAQAGEALGGDALAAPSRSDEHAVPEGDAP